VRRRRLETSARARRPDAARTAATAAQTPRAPTRAERSWLGAREHKPAHAAAAAPGPARQDWRARRPHTHTTRDRSAHARRAHAAAAPPSNEDAHTRNRDARRSLIDGVEGGPSKPCEAPVQATLVLKDGQRLEGTSFGAKVNRPGEVVFNTGMVGYPEALTDPSYRGQILVLTFPLVGNYGVPSMDTKDKWDLPLYFESDDVQIAGLVVSNYSADPSHWASQQSLGNWLAKAGVPAIFGADSV